MASSRTAMMWAPTLLYIVAALALCGASLAAVRSVHVSEAGTSILDLRVEARGHARRSRAPSIMYSVRDDRLPETRLHRRRPAKSLVDQDLLVSVGQVVLPADDGLGRDSIL